MADVMMIEPAATAERSQPRAEHALPQFSVVTQAHPLWPSMAPLRQALERASRGDCVAFAVPLDTPILSRLMTLATLRWQRRRAVRAIRSSGGEVVAHLGVDPSLAQPSWFYELDTPASDYTDRFLRPKG